MSKVRKPRGYSKAYTDKLHQIAADEGMVIPRGYTLYGADLDRGFCDWDRKMIVIPQWITRRNRPKGKGDDRYVIYYLAHELAHGYAPTHNEVSLHGPGFMRIFKEICPEDLWHYEVDYKPKLAKAAGITKRK